MATIGVLVPASPGHLNPMNSLGRELVRRGHRVVVANVVEVEAAVLAAGLEFVPIGVGSYPPGTIEEHYQRLGELQGWRAIRFTLTLMNRYAETLLGEAPEIFRSIGADLLLIDQAAPGGSSVADYLKLPYVTVANALMFNFELDIPPASTTWQPPRSALGRARIWLSYRAMRVMLGPLMRQVEQTRAKWGLVPTPDPRDWFSPLAEVGQEPAEFEFPRRELPPHFHFAGPFQDPKARAPVPFPFDRLDSRPLVYASMGTLQNRLLWIFRAIVEACDGLGVQLVISLGGSADPSVLGKLPGDPLVVRSAPQMELLDRASLTITHAGMNTTLESLARGVPMVAIPITNDQPGVAARIAWTGTGLVVSPTRLNARRLREAISRVLNEPSFRTQANRLREAIARGGGVTRAADVIERLLETGQPVLAKDFETRTNKPTPLGA